MKRVGSFTKDVRGAAVVEATIIFPVIIMIFYALVLLSFYLPTRALLQNATQRAAVSIASSLSDTWLQFEDSSGGEGWITDKDRLNNVYMDILPFGGNWSENTIRGHAEKTVKKLSDSKLIVDSGGTTDVEVEVTNLVIYQQITVTATRTIKVPVDFSFIGFPKEIPITVSSTATVQNGDEFVRNMDIAVDIFEWADEKYNISDMFSGVGKFFGKFNNLIGMS